MLPSVVVMHSDEKGPQKKRGAVGLVSSLFAYSKLGCFCAIAYLIVSTGLAGWFLAGYIKLSQIRSQYEILEKNTEYYAQQNEIHKQLNQDLKRQVDVLREQRILQTAENIRYKQENRYLNSTVRAYKGANLDLNDHILGLQETNLNYKMSNEALNITRYFLSDKVQALGKTVISINNTKENLLVISADLRQSILVLNKTTAALSFEVEKLENVVQFIEDHATANQESFDLLIATLGQMIGENRKILKEIRRQTLKQDMSKAVKDGLDDLLTYFQFKSGGRLDSEANGLYSKCLKKIENDVLREICGNVTDFEEYLLAEGVESGSTANRISFKKLWKISNSYADLVQAHYFSERDGGVTSSEWEDANYKCSDLDPVAQFDL